MTRLYTYEKFLLKSNNYRLFAGLLFSIILHILAFVFIPAFIDNNTSAYNMLEAHQLEFILEQYHPVNQLLLTDKKSAAKPMLSNAHSLVDHDKESIKSDFSNPLNKHLKNQESISSQPRKQSFHEAQLLIQQLKQKLLKIIDTETLVTGQCNLAYPYDNQNNKLKCDSGALYETISKEEHNIAALLFEISESGMPINGFSAQIKNNKPVIIFTND